MAAQDLVGAQASSYQQPECTPRMDLVVLVYDAVTAQGPSNPGVPETQIWAWEPRL